MITAHQLSLSTYGNEEIVDVCETNPVRDVFREKTSGVVLGDITIVIDIDGIHIKRYKKLI